MNHFGPEPRAVGAGSPLQVLYESPVVGKDLRWIITASASGSGVYTIRKLKEGVETVEQTGIGSLRRAKWIVEQKVIVWRAWSREK